MTSSKPNYLPKTPSPNAITLGLGLQYMNSGGYNSVPSDDPVLGAPLQVLGPAKLFFSEHLPCDRAITLPQSRTEIAHSVGCGICDKDHLLRTWLECPTYSKTELGGDVGSTNTCWGREHIVS